MLLGVKSAIRQNLYKEWIRLSSWFDILHDWSLGRGLGTIEVISRPFYYQLVSCKPIQNMYEIWGHMLIGRML
jgi:hypothetical protein